MRRIGWLGFLILFGTAWAHPSPTETLVPIYRYGHGKRITFIHVHRDERTAFAVGRQQLNNHQDSLVSLGTQGSRLIRFCHHKQCHHFDPNRIYTHQGRLKTLNKTGHATPEAEHIVAQFAKQLINQIQGKVIVALHNNIDYSLKDYLPGHHYAHHARAVYHHAGTSYHNFFFVTDRHLFTALRAKQFNVVLQNNQTVTDDGSLAVYAGRHHIPYVNIEAKRGDYKAQMQMMSGLMKLLNQSA